MGAAAFGATSRSTSPPILSANRDHGNMHSQAALRAAAQHTLDLQSFTIQTPAARIIYGAPNRTESSYILPVIVIGDTIYQGLGGTGQRGIETSVEQWGRATLKPGLDGVYGPIAAKAELRFLLRAQDVVKTSAGYRFSEMLPLNEVLPHSAGTVPVTGFASVSNQLVKSISVSYAGTHSVTYRFSSFDSSQSIVPPPAAKTVKLIPCRDGSISKSGPSGYICGLYGTAPG
jgi:hypothetical protein